MRWPPAMHLPLFITASSCSDKASCQLFATCCWDSCYISHSWYPGVFHLLVLLEAPYSSLATSLYYSVSSDNMNQWQGCSQFRSHFLNFRWASTWWSKDSRPRQSQPACNTIRSARPQRIWQILIFKTI